MDHPTTSSSGVSEGGKGPRRSPSRLPALLLFAPLTTLTLGACVATGEPDAGDDTGEAELAVTGRDVGRTINNPNAQFTGRWFLDTAGAAAEFTSPITTPDGRLALTRIGDTNYSLGVIVPPGTASPDYDAGTVAPLFMDRMLVRNADGTPRLTKITAPASGPIWSTASTSQQMGMGADPRLAGGIFVRIGGTAADHSDATANCFGDPASVAVSPSGPYECGRYLLFQPGSDGADNDKIHVASFGVVVKAYDAASPTVRLATPAIVAARFLSGFQVLKTRAGATLASSIEPSVTADSRLLVLHGGVSHFTFSETPWDPSTWEQRRSLTCLATPQGTKCPGTGAVNCATTPGSCGISDMPICVAGRDAGGSCNATTTMTLRDKYPIAAYPIRNPDGSAYQGVSANLKDFGGSYGWISFDGSELFFNIGSAAGGSRAVRAVFGKSTRGVIKHIDAQANVTTGRYCTEIGGAPDWHSIAEDPTGTGTDCVGDQAHEADGLRLAMPLGTGAGLWRFFAAESEPLLPFSRRGPLFMLVDHHQLLGNYGPAGSPAFNTTAPAGDRRYRHIYTEVALDDFADGKFAAFYHMNEMIAANSSRRDLFEENRTPDTSGSFNTAVLSGGAQLPLQRTGGVDLAGQVNAGYLGRGIFFPQGGAAKVARATSPLAGNNPLAGAMPAFTVELAVKPLTSALWAAGTTTTLAEMPGFWKLQLVADANTNLVPRITIVKQDGTTDTFGNVGALVTKATTTWTHLSLTLDLTGDRKVRFFVNGVQKQVTNALPAASRTQVPPAEANLLVLGPNGTGPAGDSYVLDEVAISTKVRDAEYIAAAAYRAPVVNFDYTKSTSDQGPFLFSDSGVLPASMRGLRARDLRIPQTFLDEVDASRQSGETWKARFDKIKRLGEALFNDDLLTVKWDAATSTYKESKDGHRCATCHVSGQGRAHQNVQLDKDIFGAPLAVNTPTSLNRAFSRRHFFDLRATDLVDQVLRPVENTAPVEMGGDGVNIASFVNGKKPDGTSYGVHAGSVGAGSADGYPGAAPARPAGVTTYLEWFRQAFGAGPTDAGVTVDRALVAHALTAFLVSQVSANQVVDQLRDGTVQAASYPSVVNGMRIFEGKGRCIACHSGSLYTDEMPHPSGPSGLATKTPTLRLVKSTAPYFRDGSKATLGEVIDFYDAGGHKKSDGNASTMVTGDPELYPLGLTAAEKADLEAFLQNL